MPRIFARCAGSGTRVRCRWNRTWIRARKPRGDARKPARGSGRANPGDKPDKPGNRKTGDRRNVFWFRIMKIMRAKALKNAAKTGDRRNVFRFSLNKLENVPSVPGFITRRSAIGILASTASAVATEQQQPQGDGPVTIGWLGGTGPGIETGVSWGVPWARGTVGRTQTFTLTANDGKALPLQAWPLAYWPDGSIKFTGFATVTGASGPFRLAPGTPAAGPPVKVTESAQAIDIDTGKLQCRIPKQGPAFLERMTIDGRVVARDGRLVCSLEDRSANGVLRFPEFTNSIKKVTVEQTGPVRAVVKLEGMHKCTSNNDAREWLPFTVRLYFYGGTEPVRLVHTIVFDGDHAQDFIKGLGLAFDLAMREQVHNRHVRFIAMLPVRGLNILTRELRPQRIAQPRHRVRQIRPRIPERLNRPIPLHPVDPPRIEPQPDQPCLKKRHVLRRHHFELHPNRQNRALRHLRIGREHRARLPRLYVLIHRMVTPVAVEVPRFRPVGVRRVDNRAEPVRLGDLPKLRQRHADRTQVDIHGAFRFMQTPARRRTEGLLPALHKIGWRLCLHIGRAEEIAQANSEPQPRQIAGHALDRRLRIGRALRQPVRQRTLIDRSNVDGH